MKSKSMLLVIDDWERLERCSDFLNNLLITTEAPFPSEGVKLAQLTEYDYILVDLTLGDMSATEFIQNLGSHCSSKFFIISDEIDLKSLCSLSIDVQCLNRNQKLSDILLQISYSVLA